MKKDVLYFLRTHLPVAWLRQVQSAWGCRTWMEESHPVVLMSLQQLYRKRRKNMYISKQAQICKFASREGDIWIKAEKVFFSTCKYNPKFDYEKNGGKAKVNHIKASK